MPVSILNVAVFLVQNTYMAKAKSKYLSRGCCPYSEKVSD